MPAIEVEHLKKIYVSHKKAPGLAGAFRGLFTREKTETIAVKDISFHIDSGEFVGFLGPNGAGKTTTLKMLTGILYPTAGRAGVLGYNPTSRRPELLRKITLLMGNKMQLWWDLPAWDGYLVLKEIYEVPADKFKLRAERLIDILQIGDKIHTQVRKLSLGERMKCELAAALLHSPEVVFLDEPTLGLDVVSQKRIREFLRDIHKEDGCTIILTSHYMQDVSELCKRVLVIDHGSLVFDGTLDALSDQFSGVRYLRLQLGAPIPDANLAIFGTLISSADQEAVIEVPRDKIAAVTAAALQALPVIDVAIEEVSIEDVVRALFAEKGPGTEQRA